MKERSSYRGGQTCVRTSFKGVRNAIGIFAALVVVSDWSGARAIAQEAEFPNEPAAVQLLRAASRLTHGSAGTFEIEMPLSGVSGVEDRTGGRSGVYSAVFTFDVAVTSGRALILDGTATAGIPSFQGNEMSVPLTEVTNAQLVTIRLENVNGSNTVDGEVVFGFLAGDPNSSRSVDGRDFLIWQRNSGQVVTGRNFGVDFDNDGLIDGNDRRILQLYRGTSLP